MRLAFPLALCAVTGCFADRVMAPLPARLAPTQLLHIPSPTPARVPGSGPRIFFYPERSSLVHPYELVIDDRRFEFPRDSARIRREAKQLSPDTISSIDIEHRGERVRVVIRTKRA